MSGPSLMKVVEGSIRLSPSTRVRHRRAVEAFLAFVGDDPSNWTGDRIHQWYTSLLGQMKAQSAKQYLNPVRYALRRYTALVGDPKFALAAEYVEMASDEPVEHRHALTLEEVGKLLRATLGNKPKDIRDRALLTWLLKTGARSMSTLGLRFEDIKTNQSSMWTATVAQKGGGTYVIPLSPLVVEQLDRWRRALSAAQGHVFRSITVEHVDGHSRIGKRLTSTGLYKIVRAIATKAGVREGDVFPHLFRHTLVTHAQKARYPLPAIAAITGHNIGGIIGTYTDLTSFGYEASNAIPDYLWEG